MDRKDFNYNIDITDAVSQTIVKYDSDIAIDITEIGIDSLITDAALKDLPIIKTAYGLIKTGLEIREIYNLKKTLVFINQLNVRGISNKNYEEYKNRLKNNDKEIRKQLQYALIIIDRYIEINKTIILANLYFNYVDKHIDWEQFTELSIIVDNMFLKDFNELKNIYLIKSLTMNDILDKTSFRRLKDQNLVEDIESIERTADGSIVHNYNEYDYHITSLGNLLYKYGLMSNE